MIVKGKLIAIIAFTSVLFISCSDDTNIPVIQQIDYGYFPSDTGTWIEYNVTQITIDADVGVDTTINYQIREVYQSKFIDNTGDESIIINRYRRTNDTESWKIEDVWYATLYTNSAHRIEENMRYVKLIFPVDEGKSWNGNAYNINSSNDQSSYIYTAIDSALSINNLYFDSTAIVNQSDKLSIVDKIYKNEIYAKNIGLIEKISIDVYSVIPDTTIDIMDRINIGTIYYQEIINYGNSKKK